MDIKKTSALKLFNHQKDAITRAKQGNLAMFHDCGTGKTCTALHIIRHYKSQGEVPALVVCPLSIIEAAWIEDCQKFTPELSIVNLHDKKPANRKKKLAEDYDIYVCNYETFKYLFKQIQEKQFKVLIVDESSKMKSPKSQITRSLLSLAGIKTRGRGGVKFPVENIVPHRYVLSGTPAPNDESEYWAQIKFITGPGGEVFNDNFYAFRRNYFYSIPIGRTGQNIWKFRKEAGVEFTQKIAETSHVVRKEDAIDLPDQVHEKRIIELSSSALVEVMKLRQLTSGFCYSDTGSHQTGKSKIKELKQLLTEIGLEKQVVIWCNFHYEIAALLKELPDSDALWSGTPDRGKVITGFQAARFRYLIANPQSAAHGLTFTNCNYAIYFSLNYSYELEKQSQDRLHRIGQKKKCTYYYLIAKDTVDEVVYKVVRKKEQLSTEILNYLRKGINNGKGSQKAERQLKSA